MRIGLITSAPDHPLLAAAGALLTAAGHRVEALDPAGRAGEGPLADAYLLKARTPAALTLARSLEERGAPVVNSAAATEFCQDRTAMAELARRAGVPFAPTRTADRPAVLLAAAEAGELAFPLVLKSRHSRRHDLVARVDDLARLRALAEEWADEPVVAQPYLPSTGWDQKLWVVAGQLFCTRRRSELADPAHTGLPHGVGGSGPAGGSGPGGGSGPVDGFGPDELPAERAGLALRVGEVFGLDVYGVDLLDGPDEPVVVDVNAFPGIRGQAGAPEALAALALRAAAAGTRERPSVPGPRAGAPADAGPPAAAR
ncbi:RimK family alpha-L-glutamate ligase [Kitasatospora sp. NPDC058032]|uniref:ATP-grasp domain-containing protein n=1 Tax=Kitasatospora sp. NPDC058032 TaxID=3346307 RepID=UPI0036D7EC70